MVTLDEARSIAHTYYDSLSSEVHETEDLYIFHHDTHGIECAGGGDPVAVSKRDGSSHLLYFVLDDSWEIFDKMTLVKQR